jgi:hypothetical protein
MSKGYNDHEDRMWGIDFLENAKGKTNLSLGTQWGIDIKSVTGIYGADVENAKSYNPLKRDRGITIPLRKHLISKYWDGESECDYITFIGGDENPHEKLIYIPSKVIKQNLDNQKYTPTVWNKKNRREKPYRGYTLEETHIIQDTMIEIPKSQTEIWKYVNNTWVQLPNNFRGISNNQPKSHSFF